MSLLLAAMVLLQDPVPGLLGKIDGKDPEACFRAIAELADLGPSRRAEIEKGAEKLPEFYRQALLAELRETAPVKRVTIQGKGRAGSSYLEELGGKVGDVYWNRNQLDNDEPEPVALDLDLKDRPALEALRRICVEGAFYPTNIVWGYDKTHYSWAFTGRRALAVRYYSDLVRSIPLGGKVTWRARIEVSLIAEPGVHILSADDVKLFEAVAKGGRALREHPGEAESTVSRRYYGPTVYAQEWDSVAGVEIDVPGDIEAIERLRIAFLPKVATSVCQLELPVDPSGKKETVSKDGFTVTMLDDPAMAQKGDDPRIRISSNRLTRDELIKLPIKAEFVGESSTDVDLGEITPADGQAMDCVVRVNMEPPQKAFKVRLHFPLAIEVKPIYAEFRDIPLK